MKGAAESFPHQVILAIAVRGDAARSSSIKVENPFLKRCHPGRCKCITTKLFAENDLGLRKQIPPLPIFLPCPWFLSTASVGYLRGLTSNSISVAMRLKRLLSLTFGLLSMGYLLIQFTRSWSIIQQKSNPIAFLSDFSNINYMQLYSIIDILITKSSKKSDYAVFYASYNLNFARPGKLRVQGAQGGAVVRLPQTGSNAKAGALRGIPNGKLTRSILGLIPGFNNFYLWPAFTDAVLIDWRDELVGCCEKKLDSV